MLGQGKDKAMVNHRPDRVGGACTSSACRQAPLEEKLNTTGLNFKLNEEANQAEKTLI